MVQATVFFLIRHGEAVENVLNIPDAFPGNPAYGLTEKGREQVKNSVKEVADVGLDFLFASPMRRTRETAEIVSSACGDIPVIFDERLRETDFGIWSGQSAELFNGKRGKYHDPLLRVDGNVNEGLEGFRDIRKRVAGFLGDILVENAGKRIAIVSHGDPTEQMHGILVGDDVETAATGWYPKRGSANRIEIGPETVSRLLSENGWR
jgi:broad specificity phosphatase PhoE